ncbi:hypothetical protein C8R43DRAFT_819724, partial [Mycena crocata]
DASLVDPATHSPALIALINIQIAKPVIKYIIDSVAETVNLGMGRTQSPAHTCETSCVCSGQSTYNTIKFAPFVTAVISRAEVTTPTVLTALVYISRVRPHLTIAVEKWAFERVFLGALIVASKYTHDITLKNVHWALCTGLFGKRDIGLIEREFLGVLDWNLRVRESEL